MRTVVPVLRWPQSPMRDKGSVETGAESDVMHAAAALDLDFEADRQRIGHRNADAVQAARETVGVAGFLLVELAAGVQLAEDQFDRRPAFFRVNLDRDAAAVVLDFNDAIGPDQHADFFGVTGQRLVEQALSMTS